MFQHTVTSTEGVRYSPLGHSARPEGVIYCCLRHQADKIFVLKESPQNLAPESFLSNHYQQETHKKQSSFHNWKTSLSTSSSPSLEKFPSLISEDALLTHFFLISHFYPPPPLITSFPYLISSLTLKLRQPQTVSNNCFISAPVCPQTPWHSPATPDAAQVLHTSISGAV